MKKWFKNPWLHFKSLFAEPPDAPKPDTEQVIFELFAYLRRDRQAARFRRGFMIMGLGLIMLAPLGFYVYSNIPDGYWAIGKKLAYVRIGGLIGVQGGVDADRVIKSLNRAFESNAVAVAIKIDSPGGSPYTSDRIVAVIEHLREEHPDKPLYAVIERTGASAAYMIAMHTDEIHVSDYSAVGSVGAILTSWDLHDLSERLDVDKHVFASGRLKGMLDPFKPLTEDEAAKAQAIVDAIGTIFADQVVEKRGERLKLSREALTTGEIWVGREAIEHGLADKIGTIDTLGYELDATPLDMTAHVSPFSSAVSSLGSQVTLGVLNVLSERSLR